MNAVPPVLIPASRRSCRARGSYFVTTGGRKVWVVLNEKTDATGGEIHADIQASLARGVTLRSIATRPSTTEQITWGSLIVLLVSGLLIMTLLLVSGSGLISLHQRLPLSIPLLGGMPVLAATFLFILVAVPFAIATLSGICIYRFRYRASPLTPCNDDQTPLQVSGHPKDHSSTC